MVKNQEETVAQYQNYFNEWEDKNKQMKKIKRLHSARNYDGLIQKEM